MRTKTIPGQTYNKLTAIREIGTNKNRKKVWLWQCECGRQTEQIATEVRSGHIKSCGCLRATNMDKYNKERPRVHIIAGKTYGLLTAVEATNEKGSGGHYMWVFDCECGTRIKASASAVIHGIKKSCGCLRAQMAIGIKGVAPATGHTKIITDELMMPRRAWMNTYRDGCPLEEFIRLSQEPCHYCGRMLSNTIKRDGREWKYNGLDRKDPTKDHSLDNVVPCCYPCNLAKGTRTYEEFILWIDTVYNYFRKCHTSLV